MKVHARCTWTIDGIDHVGHDPCGYEPDKHQSTLKAIAGFLRSISNLLTRCRNLLIKSPPFTVRANLLSLIVSGVLDVAGAAHRKITGNKLTLLLYGSAHRRVHRHECHCLSRKRLRGSNICAKISIALLLLSQQLALISKINQCANGNHPGLVALVG